MTRPRHYRCCIAAALFVLAAIATPTAQAQTFTVLHHFTLADGSEPSGLRLDAAGNLYGTTLLGGAADQGVVFELNAAGETVLLSFMGAEGTDPTTGVIRDPAGNLYGTTAGGVTPFGQVFKLDKAGGVTVLHSFPGGVDGGEPNALIRDPNGNIYGTTYIGGTWGHGVAFKLDANGAETILHNFEGPDGGQPASKLTRDLDGDLYGTTYGGGISPGNGVVFKLDASGSETVLYSFTGGADGAKPHAGLIRDPAGNIYGTTTRGGMVNRACPDGCGVVFKLDPAGNETVLHSFTGGADGMSPTTTLICDTAGNLYGTTSTGGATGWGVVFEVDAAGTETVLHSFTGGDDGGDPETGLVRDQAGNLYGTTAYGPSDYGAAFKLRP